MKTFYRIPSRETGTELLKCRKSIKGLYFWLSKHCITLLLAIFLLMIVAPADASNGSGKNNSGKNRKSMCNAKKTRLTYPIIIKAKKKTSPYNKKHSRSEKRNYSFPV